MLKFCSIWLHEARHETSVLSTQRNAQKHYSIQMAFVSRSARASIALAGTPKRSWDQTHLRDLLIRGCDWSVLMSFHFSTSRLGSRSSRLLKTLGRLIRPPRRSGPIVPLVSQQGSTSIICKNGWLGPQMLATAMSHVYTARKRRGMAFKTDIIGIRYSDVFIFRQRLASILHASLKDFTYRPSAPVERASKVRNKVRFICNYSTFDLVVQGLLYRCLSDLAAPHLSKNEYGYLKGKSTECAIRTLCDYFKGARKTHLRNGVFALKLDIKSYIENIPTSSASSLWTNLRTMFDCLPDRHLHDYLMALVRDGLRPVLHTAEGLQYQRIRGVPTGTC